VFDVESWLKTGGLALLAAIVFAESGLFFGFFLPGDSLLFVAGFLSSDAGGNVLPALPITAGVVFIAAFMGDQVGYLFGKRVGPSLFNRPESRLFSPKNALRAQDFFERRGGKAIVLARFVPIVRTFVPIVAGVGEMPYRSFVTYNLIGAALWGVGITTLGYFLGEVHFIEQNLEIAAVLIVAVSLIPVVFEVRRTRRERREEALAEVADTPSL
jgi:membrane-associated protein